MTSCQLLYQNVYRNFLAEGTVLAALVWFLLRFVPRKNSGTRFAIWFSTLVAMIVLPFLSALPRSTGIAGAGHGITVPASVRWQSAQRTKRELSDSRFAGAHHSAGRPAGEEDNQENLRDNIPHKRAKTILSADVTN